MDDNQQQLTAQLQQMQQQLQHVIQAQEPAAQQAAEQTALQQEQAAPIGQKNCQAMDFTHFQPWSISVLIYIYYYIESIQSIYRFMDNLEEYGDFGVF